MGMAKNRIGRRAMGLDNSPARDPEGTLLPEDEEAFRKSGIRLCGALFSDGTVSPGEGVQRPGRSGDRGQPVSGVDPAGDGAEEHVKEMESLQQRFLICARRGLGLIGWW
jgi:hypothetical protein